MALRELTIVSASEREARRAEKAARNANVLGVASVYDEPETTDIIERTINDSGTILLILGHHYGELLPDEGINWIEYAYELARRKGLSTIALVLDRKEVQRRRHQLYSSSARETATAERLDRFRERVIEGSDSWRVWTSWSDFDHQVAAAISDWMRRGRQEDIPDPSTVGAVLRVHAETAGVVSDIRNYLSALQEAYNRIVVFDSILSARLPISTLTNLKDVDSMITPQYELVLDGVSLSSPGAWDFLGKLNPLDVIRQYLTDRHERRKDKEYREAHENRKLYLENKLLENRVLKENIQVARELGATDGDLVPILNRFVFAPLRGLDKFQDQGLIQQAEFQESPDVSEAGAGGSKSVRKKAKGAAAGA